MVDSTVPQSPQSPPLSTSIRRASTFADRPSASSHRFSPSNEPPTPGIRRRSSNLSEFSNEARRQILTSTDDLLNPRPGAGGLEGDAAQTQRDATHWDSAPLAFALLPALGGLVFKNGSSVVTDVMLLGLAAIFLNWSVRIPWYVCYITRGGVVSADLEEIGIGITPPRRFGKERRSTMKL